MSSLADTARIAASGAWRSHATSGRVAGTSSSARPRALGLLGRRQTDPQQMRWLSLASRWRRPPRPRRRCRV